MDRGGAETMIMNYYRAIDRSKIQFDFVVNTTDKCAFDDEIESMGGLIFRFPRLNGINLLSYQKTWKNFFKAYSDYKIIHVHFFKIAGAILPIAKSYSIPVRIVHMHTAHPNYTLHRKLAYEFLRFYANKTMTHAFACGKDAGYCFFGKRQFELLNNAIDAEKFKFNFSRRTKIRNGLGLEDKFVVGHIGRFISLKNHTFIVGIFKKISKLNEKAILLLVGDGPLRHEIKDKVDGLGLQDKVKFVGVRADIPDLLQAMDVFLFPSFLEGLPVTVVEAQAAGLQVIASDTITKEVNITDLVQNYSLNEPPSIWAEAINSYAKGYIRKDTYSQIVNAGYDIEINAKWLENFYENALKNG
ncbi:MAG: glycosyltransferase family 1 protein [Prevotellaceae bacterium]|jgi:glycosyltransferase involved in cell wall biosynthesis|nr:glycosyltransferase family 1 protein [Prevotellaceae bacterium]